MYFFYHIILENFSSIVNMSRFKYNKYKKKNLFYISNKKQTKIVKLTVAGQFGLHGLCANKKQEKNVNAVHDHVLNRNLNFMENYVKEIILK